MRRSSEAWWNAHWGAPCHLHDPTFVNISGHLFRTDARMVPAWEAFEQVRARHDYTIHAPYPAGDSGMYNCRHIGGDPERPMSVHAWAGALDANWRTNPDGSRLQTDMPKPLRDDLHALRTRSGAPLFRWGGDWDRDPRTGHSYYDAMHWEIVATPAEIASGVIDPNATPDTEDDEMTPEQSKKLDDLHAQVPALRGAVDAHFRDTLSRLEALEAGDKRHDAMLRDSLARLIRDEVVAALKAHDEG